MLFSVVPSESREGPTKPGDDSPVDEVALTGTTGTCTYIGGRGGLIRAAVNCTGRHRVFFSRYAYSSRTSDRRS